MRDELYINDRLVDLPENPNIGLDYDQGDIGEMDSRKANKSTSITVPFTALNLDIFGFCNIPESGSTIPYNNLPCKYKKYGVEAIKKGTVVIDEITQEGFSINMYWGAFDFFALIKDKKLTDLDTTAIEEDWTPSNVASKIAATSGLTYPLASCGEGFPDTHTLIGDTTHGSLLYPAVYVKWILDKIHSDAGFTYSGFPVGSFLNKVLPVINNKSNALLNTRLQCRYDSVGYYNIDKPLSGRMKVTFATLSSDYYSRFNTQIYKAPMNGTYSFDVRVNFTKLASPLGGDNSMSIFLRNSNNSLTDGYVTPSTNTEDTYTKNFTLTTNLNANDTVWVDVEFFGSGHEGCDINYGYFKCSSASVQTTEFWFVYPLAINFPDILQSDFVKALMQEYCLFCFQNYNEIVYYTLDEITANKSKAINLDNKVIGQRRIFKNAKFAIDGFSQRNWWKYSDDDYYPKGDADGYLACNNTNLDLEKTIYTSPFTPCYDAILLSGIKMAKINRLLTQTFKICKPKILSTYVKTATLGIDDAMGGYIYVTSFNVATFDDAVNADSRKWDAILTANYNVLTDILTNPKLIIVDVDFKITDFINIDPVIPYFLWNSYYLLKNIQNFNPENPTELTLIKI